MGELDDIFAPLAPATVGSPKLDAIFGAAPIAPSVDDIYGELAAGAEVSAMQPEQKYRRSKSGAIKANIRKQKGGVLNKLYNRGGTRELEIAEQLKQLYDMPLDELGRVAESKARAEVLAGRATDLQSESDRQFQILSKQRLEWETHAKAGLSAQEAVAKMLRGGAAPRGATPYPERKEHGAILSGLPYTSEDADIDDYRREKGVPHPSIAVDRERKDAIVAGESDYYDKRLMDADPERTRKELTEGLPPAALDEAAKADITIGRPKTTLESVFDEYPVAANVVAGPVLAGARAAGSKLADAFGDSLPADPEGVHEEASKRGLRTGDVVEERVRVGAPSKSGDSWYASASRGFDKPSRMMVAGMNGVLRTAREAAGDAPIEPTEYTEGEQPSWSSSEIVPRDTGGPVKTRSAGIPHSAWADVWSKPELRQKLMKNVTDDVKGAWDNQDPQSVHDFATFLKEAQENYWSTAHNMAIEQLDLEELAKLSENDAQDMVDITTEGIYEDLLRQDSAAGAIEHELVAQVAAQFALDPLWFVSPLKAFKAGRGVLRFASGGAFGGVAGDAAGVVLKASEAMAKGFLHSTEKIRWMGVLTDLERAGTKAGRDLAKLMESGALRAPYQHRLLLKSAEDNLKIGKKIKGEDAKELFARVVDWNSYPEAERVSADSAVEFLKRSGRGEKDIATFNQALSDYAEWQVAHEDFISKTGVGNYWDAKGVLHHADEYFEPRENWGREGGGYMARREPTDASEVKDIIERERAGEAAYAGRGTLTTGSGKARKRNPAGELVVDPQYWRQDAIRQALHETHGPLGAAGTAAQEMKFIDKFAREANLSRDAVTQGVTAGIIDVPMKEYERLKKNGMLDGFLRGLEKRTGVPYDVMHEAALLDPFMKATAAKGTVRGSMVKIMARPVKKRIDQIVPLLATAGHGDAKDGLILAENIIKWTARPFNNFGRWVTTIPNQIFPSRNTGGAQVIAYLHHGVAAFAPKRQTLAGEAAILLTWPEDKISKVPWLGPKWMDGTTTLMNGKRVPRREFQKVLQEDMGKQLASRLNQYRDPLTRGSRGLPGFMGKELPEFMQKGPLKGQTYAGLAQGARDFPQAAATAVGEHTMYGTPFIPGPKVLSYATVSELSEGFQHTLGYAPALKGLDDLSRAEALHVMGKYYGDYRRLSAPERMIMNDVVFFYAWQKFITTRGIRAAIEEPRRVAQFETMLEHFRRLWGGQAPVPPEATSQFSKGMAVTAPPDWQPEGVKRRSADARAAWKGISYNDFLRMYNDGKAELPEPGSDNYISMTVDVPMSMSFYMSANMQGALSGLGDQNFYDVAAPFAAAALGIGMGVNKWGLKEGAGDIAMSHIYGMTTESRPMKDWRRIAKMYLENTPQPKTEGAQFARKMAAKCIEDGQLNEAMRWNEMVKMQSSTPFSAIAVEAAINMARPEDDPVDMPPAAPIPGVTLMQTVDPVNNMNRAGAKAQAEAGLQAFQIQKTK